ncbi:hypothetical protein MJO29_015653 [Puccinia striiformis f. sp. tritici]|uniref:hypothetical protein n=1 Tax=Puccinia striiformis f. sp. tritici TaxID=168172 RepID=UPI002008DAD7|nr:hypothetical protein Pst134EA_029291 [Puccinia striiformis f. sp. tritici]KAH9447257.1 hypothetical protein Pst134EA_029291 [Puccinia striiformis f. sp. tritici]KAI7936350.1 hypothetical protein MJO29_015653 [Puccinia striiformis f. sp. tritici]
MTTTEQSKQEEEDDPILALDLRLRLLECVFAGALSSSDSFTATTTTQNGNKTSIALRLERLLAHLTTILDTKPNDAIHRFVQSYDLNEPLLHLPNPLPTTKETSQLSLNEKASLVFEAEPEIVQVERDLREIEVLDNRGFVGAGKLVNGDWTDEELSSTIVKPLQESTKSIQELEQRITSLMSDYDSYVNALSEIFVSWDSILSSIELDLHKLQIHKPSS